ncbi:MAG: hypothetical protein LUD81_05595 [Clostridiales bacterium]|nr:hypothetical protein [Clostridiales bacterium]
MAKLVWDKTGERFYETGVKKGVFYPIDKTGAYPVGFVWNGLTAVTESPEGAEPTSMYADDMKYLNLLSTEEFKATIEAYSCPDEFKECDGKAEIAAGVTISQQRRKMFGMAYTTTLGNDIEVDDCGYKTHLIYGALASPADKSYQTINDSPEPITLSYEISTTPVEISGCKPTATFVLDSLKFKEAGIFNVLQIIEEMLYGSEETDPYLPEVSEILETYETGMNLLDSGGDFILDSEGNKIRTVVYE